MYIRFTQIKSLALVLMAIVFFLIIIFNWLENNLNNRNQTIVNVLVDYKQQLNIEQYKIIISLMNLVKVSIITSGTFISKYGDHTNQFRLKEKSKDGSDQRVTNDDIISNQIIQKYLKNIQGLKIISEEKTDESINIPTNILQIFKNNLWSSSDTIRPLTLEQLGNVALWIDPLDATYEYTMNMNEYVSVMGCLTLDTIPIASIIHFPFNGNIISKILSENNDLDHTCFLINNKDERIEDIRFVVSQTHTAKSMDFLEKQLEIKPRNIMKAGGSGFKFNLILNGTVNVYLHTGYINKWDICAIVHLANNCNLHVSDLNGQAITFNTNDNVHQTGLLISSNKKMFNKIIETWKIYNSN